jgi:hypothetical protein
MKTFASMDFKKTNIKVDAIPAGKLIFAPVAVNGRSQTKDGRNCLRKCVKFSFTDSVNELEQIDVV